MPPTPWNRKTPRSAPPDFSGIERALTGKILVLDTEALKYEDRRAIPYEEYVSGLARDPEAALGQTPNYEKLTRTERWIMNRLPGFSESGVGQALAKFGESWLGKTLSFLDVPAEGLERATGFATQALAAIGSQEGWEDFTQNLNAAWYAGSLAGDMANLPQFTSVDGRPTLRVPTDLPGFEGLVDARQQITRLIHDGTDPGEALIQVRDQYYDSLGALALRSQLNDTFFHIAADPINVVLPYLKPAERAAKFTARLGEKFFVSAIEDAARAASFADEEVRIQRVLLTAATELGDQVEITRLSRVVADADEYAKGVRELAEFAARNRLGPIEEKLVHLLGMDTDDPTKLAKLKFNPFALTPSSRGHDYMNRVLTNVMTRLFSQTDEPETIARVLKRAVDGLFTKELGHHILTVEGRSTRAALQTISAHVDDALKAWRKTEEFEGPLLRSLAGIMGEDTSKLVSRIADGEGSILVQKLVEHLQSAERTSEIHFLMGAKGLTADAVGAQKAIDLLSIFEKVPIYNKQLFQLEVSNRIIDSVAQLAVSKFGLQARGPIYQFADAMKAAETLAFLKMNPVYPVKNAINNFFTSVARGVYGNPIENYEDMFIKLKLPEPLRFRSGVGLAGIAEGEPGVAKALERGSQLLMQVELGKGNWLRKFTSWMNERRGLGFADLAQKFEQKSSIRAFGAAFNRYMGEAWQPGKGFQTISEFNPRLAEILGPERARQIEKLVQSNWSPELLRDAFLADNPNLNMANLLDGATTRSGLPISNILGPDYTQQLGERIIVAARGGPGELRREMGRVRKFIQNHIDEQLDVAKETILEQTASRVSAEGPGALPYLLSESMDDMWGASHRHAMEMAKIGDQIRGLADPTRRNAFWDNLLSDNEQFFSRFWQRFDSRMQGVQKGIDNSIEQLRRNGRLSPELLKELHSVQRESLATFKKWRGGWEDFFAKRNDALKKIRGLTGADRGKEYSRLASELDLDYLDIVAKEDNLLYQMDEIFARGMPEAERELYMVYRDGVANIRRELREDVMNFRRTVRQMPAEERQAAWTEFWQGYQKKTADIQQSELAIKTALDGDPKARAFLGFTVPEGQALREAKSRLLRGLDVTDEQRSLLDRVKKGMFVTDDLKQLRRQLGAFTPENVSAKMDVLKPPRAPAEVLDSVRWVKNPAPTDIADQVARRQWLDNYITPEGKAKLASISDWETEVSKATAFEGEIAGAVPVDLEKLGFAKPVATAWSAEVQVQLAVDRAVGATPEQAARLTKTYDAARNATKVALKDEGLTRVAVRRAVNQLQDPAKISATRVKNAEVASKIYAEAEELSKPNINELLLAWVERDADMKEDLVQFIQENPKAAKEIQDFAQWWLREQGFTSLKINGGRLRMYRGVKPRASPGLDAVKFQAYDSFTPDADIAKRLSWGGDVIELDIPVENIFTHSGAHPSFALQRNESEFITNDLGIKGARVVSINGQLPTEDMIRTLRVNNPELSAMRSEFQGLLDFHKQADVQRQLILGQGIDELWFTRGSEAIEALENSAYDLLGRKSLKIDVPTEAQDLLKGYVSNTETQMGESLHSAYRMAEWGRDSALLNYNRRLNYNSWLGLIAPYEFWFTNSAYRWALHSMDRPAMLTTFLRMKKLLETGFRPEGGIPERLRGNIRIPVPFMPEWMGGNLFVDPFRAALPIDQFGFGIDQYERQAATDESAATRVLEELLEDKRISELDYREALATRQGPVWDRALDLAKMDDAQGRQNSFDFINMMTPMHAPIQWAYNVARGEKDRIMPFFPLTRTIKGISALLGISPNTGGLNPEAMIRQALGLPAYDKWDDYRVDRMLSNMAATGEYTVDDVLRAMIERNGETYLEATARAGKEFGVGALGSLLGMPVKAYPTGEEIQRELRIKYEAAWKAYEDGDPDAVQKFYDKYPEYEARLALFKTPEERLKRFLIDNIWDAWNNMPKLNQDEVKEHLGDLFQNAFIDKDTRSYDGISINHLQVWLKVMGGDPPGQFTFSDNLTPLELTEPDVAYRVQVFYDSRDTLFDYNENIWPLQKEYYQLEEGAARKKYIFEHKELKIYWDWRRDFLLRNPTLAPYLEDDPEKLPKYRSEAELEATLGAEPTFAPEELASFDIRTLRTNPEILDQLPDGPFKRLLMDYVNGIALPDHIAEAYGLTQP